MPVLSPTIINHSEPAVSVSVAGGLPYSNFIRSLGSYVYAIQTLFVQSQNMAQANNIISFRANDSNGESSAKALVPLLDRYQRQSSYELDLRRDDIVLDGRSQLALDVNGGESLTVVLQAEERSVSEYLSGETVLKEVKTALGIGQLFNDYNDEIHE